MGNSHPNNTIASKYINSKDARVSIGQETWVRIKSQLERSYGKTIDYDTFEKIMKARFEKMSKLLMECLYQALANDLHNKIELNDFLSGLSLVSGAQDKLLFLRFLFRVYDLRQVGRLDRRDVEKVLIVAYGDKYKASSSSAVARLLSKMFTIESDKDAGSENGRMATAQGESSFLTLKEFLTFDGRLDILGGWIQAVLRAVLEPLPPKILQLDAKYSTVREQDVVTSRYGISPTVYAQLKHTFLEACGGVGVARAELSLAHWLRWTQPFLPTTTAKIIFLSRVQSLKPVWRFSDFADFALVFGVGSVEDKVNAVLRSLMRGLDHQRSDSSVPLTDSLTHDNPTSASPTCSGLLGRSLYCQMVLFLAQQSDLPQTSSSPDGISQIVIDSTLSPGPLFDLSVSNGSGSLGGSPTTNEMPWIDEFFSICAECVDKLPSEVQVALDELEDSFGAAKTTSSDTTAPSLSPKSQPAGAASDLDIDDENSTTSHASINLSDYAALIIHHHRHFTLLKALSVVACCLFGVRPQTPSQEKEYIMELLLRHYNDIPHSNSNPYGPVGSTWCVLAKTWYDTWQFYVGNSRVRQMYALQQQQLQRQRMLAEKAKKRRRFKRKKEKEAERVDAADTVLAQEGTADEANGPLFSRVYTEEDLPPEPGAIDNWSILQKSGPTQLLHNSVVGQHLELVPPSVFKTLYSWYGGGPRIVRRVIVSPSGGNELELYPLCLRTYICDPETGDADRGYKELLFSKTATILDITNTLTQSFGFGRLISNAHSSTTPMSEATSSGSRSDLLTDVGSDEETDADGNTLCKARLWNLAHESVSEQYVISPELTLVKAALQDGQNVLLEVCIQGRWPRAQLQLGECKGRITDDDQDEGSNDPAQLLSDFNSASGRPNDGANSANASGASSRFGLDVTSYFAKIKPRDTPVDGKQRQDNPNSAAIDTFHRNNGRVGLDNLGNTCYLNASLQALLHTDPLVEYFFKELHLQDINKRSKHGHGGRLAMAFARLLFELWTCPVPNASGSSTSATPMRGFPRIGKSRHAGAHISPRKFHQEFAALAEQFRGHMQHDAQEVLACILDGLSEDLNLVLNKPYVEYPDSNGRPDAELADIWWKQHFMRDFSVIQALFSGQFKSIVTCGCSFSSARFEPFMFLTLPLPEEKLRALTIYVVTLAQPFALKCCVRVPKDAVLTDVVNKIIGFDLAGVPANAVFTAGEVVNSKVVLLCSLSRRVGTIRDGDNLFLFQMAPLAPTSSVTAVSSSSEVKDDALLALAIDDVQIREESQALSPDFLPAKLSALEVPSEDRSNQAADSAGDANHSFPVTQPSSPKTISNSETSDAVRVIIVQRKVTLSNGGGIECYRMDSFGLPIVLLCQRSDTSRELYEKVAARVSAFLTAPVQSSVAPGSGYFCAKKFPSGDLLNMVPSSNAESAPITKSQQISTDSGSEVMNAMNATAALTASSFHQDSIQSLLTEDLLASSVIPRHGFCLRFITASQNSNNICSRCPWISQCQGCLLPDSELTLKDFADGQILALDWHMVVFEELLDTHTASEVKVHESLLQEQATSLKKCIPFASCLDKFTEVEKIEDVVCPKCKSDSNMSKQLTLWRPPPILVVQLKRFQYDRLSRRKLHDKVDFPIDNLDLTDYFGCSHVQPNTVETKPDGDTSVTNATSSDQATKLNAEKLCSGPCCCIYDLYAIVHHQGAMGEGHYVATTRKLPSRRGFTSSGSSSSLASTTASSSTSLRTPTKQPPSTPLRGQTPSVTTPSFADKSISTGEWVCYNDGITSTIKVEDIIASASAYVLFYMRRDAQGQSVEQLFSVADEHRRRTKRISSDDANTANGSSDTRTPSRTGSSATPSKSQQGLDPFDRRHGNNDGCSIQ